MLNYVLTMAKAKMSKKGAMFVEYAMILAFVLVVAAVLLSDSGLKTSIEAIFTKTSSTLNTAATK